MSTDCGSSSTKREPKRSCYIYWINRLKLTRMSFNWCVKLPLDFRCGIACQIEFNKRKKLVCRLSLLIVISLRVSKTRLSPKSFDFDDRECAQFHWLIHGQLIGHLSHNIMLAHEYTHTHTYE